MAIHGAGSSQQQRQVLQPSPYVQLVLQQGLFHRVRNKTVMRMATAFVLAHARAKGCYGSMCLEVVLSSQVLADICLVERHNA